MGLTGVVGQVSKQRACLLSTKARDPARLLADPQPTQQLDATKIVHALSLLCRIGLLQSGEFEPLFAPLTPISCLCESASYRGRKRQKPEIGFPPLYRFCGLFGVCSESAVSMKTTNESAGSYVRRS